MFGFKEIYSAFVRKSHVHTEIIAQGVEFVRVLFPRAKFIFHWRSNVSRIAHSDFWQLEDARSAAQMNFRGMVSLFEAYTVKHPDYTYATTLEGITNRSDVSQLQGLFDFLGERLTLKVRRLAYQRSGLRDWVEETHMRSIKVVKEDGSVVVEKKAYAWRPDELGKGAPEMQPGGAEGAAGGGARA